MMGLEDERQEMGRPASARWLTDAARALDSVESRVGRAAGDLFRSDGPDLSDQHRAQIAQLMRALIGAIEDDLRIRLIDSLADEPHPELLAALGSATMPIAQPLLERTRLLREADLVAAMLRRVDEHRLALMLGRDSPYHVADLAQRLLDLGDAAIAEATMALLVAESRRYDPFGDPALARTDLPPGPHRKLLWAVAAALRHYLIRHHGLPDSQADLLLAAAVRALLAEHDDADTLEGRADALAALLDAAGLIDDALLVDALEEGWLALFTAAVARRAGIDSAGVWSMITDPSGMMLGTVLRAIDCGREAAVTMLWRIGSAEGADEEAIVARADAFDALGRREAAEAVLIWRLDPNYRRAVIEIGEGGRRR
ncbi:DUF2336 domain-containing protein [Rhizorhabdus wittichii]|jgi:uncharacterized protein (DUF2336 family)|uniref:DUF2336 domain-containing protein n=1 Tax=Rhizorhabdus wittichii TaxID=160791 RepID=A0A975CZ32_9SPHN|nr:DUF2336 domain-containing protein [Rhizorhabdus wittichii]ARR53638.1 hypothetical protein HY78_09505 [Rhizorhabdus wittichii DC-6]QTH19952.1 DUF2336 domain-containing protein [Rhizorhabdus wittichii]